MSAINNVFLVSGGKWSWGRGDIILSGFAHIAGMASHKRYERKPSVTTLPSRLDYVESREPSMCTRMGFITRSSAWRLGAGQVAFERSPYCVLRGKGDQSIRCSLVSLWMELHNGSPCCGSHYHSRRLAPPVIQLNPPRIHPF